MGKVEYICGGFDVDEEFIDEIEVSDKWIKNDDTIYINEDKFHAYNGFTDKTLLNEIINIIDQINKLNLKLSFSAMSVECDVCGWGGHYILHLIPNKNIIEVMQMDYGNLNTTKWTYDYSNNKINIIKTETLKLNDE